LFFTAILLCVVASFAVVTLVREVLTVKYQGLVAVVTSILLGISFFVCLHLFLIVPKRSCDLLISERRQAELVFDGVSVLIPGTPPPAYSEIEAGRVFAYPAI
jgi:hypothetical protein